MKTLEKELAGEKTPTVAEERPRMAWNWVLLSGRIISAVEKKTIKDQTLICFSLAFPSRRKAEKSGSHVGFISVELWGKTAELYFPLLEKGLAVCITGELVHQRWVSVDGKRMQKFLISAQTLAISDPKFRAVA